jgi:hypothetical protein
LLDKEFQALASVQYPLPPKKIPFSRRPVQANPMDEVDFFVAMVNET